MAHRVVFVDHATALGGAERSLLILLKHLDRRRWQPQLACSRGLLADQAAALNIATHIIPMLRLRRSPRAALDWMSGVRVIARLARQASAAMLIANTVRAALYTAPAARLARIPFIWHMRDFWLSESRPGRLWADSLGKQLLCSSASRVIVNSQAVAANLPCSPRVTVVHNGIELGCFDQNMEGQPFREQHGIPCKAPLVGMVGRLRPWKGQARFLRAMARLRSEVPEAWGVIVGGAIFDAGDDYEQQLRLLASELGLVGRVVFTGQLEDVRPALAAMDLFVHPGDPEPFGLVNVEAMAMAKPVVAFDHGALPEIVVSGETGLLVPADDEAAMAEAVVSLLRDPAQSRTMGQAGRARVQACFTAERMVAAVEVVVQQVLAR